jgi:hypothetical protein
LGNMFDFNPNDQRAPKLILDETTGQVVSGGEGGGGQGGQGGGGGGQGGQGGGQGGSGQGGSGKGGSGGGKGQGGHGHDQQTFVCKATGKGKKFVVTCTIESAGRGTGKEAVRLRIVKGSKVLATSRTFLKGTHASTVLNTAKALTPGAYTLRIAISSQAGVSGANQTVKLG